MPRDLTDEEFDRIIAWENKLRAENARLRELVRILLDNDPDDLIADGGLTVLDGWRDSARKLLG
jgi:hypothetical protein